MADTGRQMMGDVYSEVLFELAEQAGRADDVMKDLQKVSEILRQEYEFSALLNSQGIKGSEKAEMVKRIFEGKVNPLTVDFLVVLARRGRMSLVSGITGKYEMQLDVHHGRVAVEVTLSSEPDDAQKDDIKQRLSRAIDREVKLIVNVDQSLIGGAVIKKQDRMIDNSVKGILKRAVSEVMEKVGDLK